MVYLEHKVAMALRLGRWAAPAGRKPRAHERELEAAREQHAPPRSEKIRKLGRFRLFRWRIV